MGNVSNIMFEIRFASIMRTCLRRFYCIALCFLLVIIWQFIALDTFSIGDPSKFNNVQTGTGQVENNRKSVGRQSSSHDEITIPIIIWWTKFSPGTGPRSCGTFSCLFTSDLRYFTHPNTRSFIFYGTDINDTALPVPRQPQHTWSLLHEESPKNVYSYNHGEMMELFNYTATFKRESHVPLLFQSFPGLRSLLSLKFFVSVEEKNKQLANLAPVVYVQSDCDSPSDRDHFVSRLMNYIKVDSYGSCLHNRNLPKKLADPIPGMDDDDFYHIMGHYKFTIYAENAFCDDYVTEKLWRTLVVGSVPVAWTDKPSNRSRLADVLPTNKSAIFASDFPSIGQLAEYLHYLNSNDSAYNEYLSHKTVGVTNERFAAMAPKFQPAYGQGVFGELVDEFACYVCDKVAQPFHRDQPTERSIANASHYGCPRPVQLVRSGHDRLEFEPSSMWSYAWADGKRRAQALKRLVEKGTVFTERDLRREMAGLSKVDYAV